MDTLKIHELEQTARVLRHQILDMIGPDGHTGHWGGSSSVCDVVTALYFYKMRYDGKDPAWEGRDRLILSKGHAALVQYAALAKLGVLPEDELKTVKVIGTRLQGHPDRAKCPGIEANTGSLGMGLSQGLGLALGLGDGQRVYVILGDGELDEGQVWEAAMAAAAYKADNLTAIIDRNRIQATSTNEAVMPLGDVAAKFEAFGWNVITVDGHDMGAICAALDEECTEKPTAIIANTVKGKGVSFAENSASWHNGSFTPEQFAAAHRELDDAFGDGEYWQGRAPAPAEAKSAAAGKTSSQRRAYGETLTALGAEDETIVALEADLSKSTMGNLFGAAYPERFYEMGIAEQNMASVAAGLSLAGKKPFMASFAVFATGRCYDQIRSNVCIPNLNVKICGSSAGLSDFGDGSTHQSIDDIALMRVLPNMQVFVPCDAPETQRILRYMAKEHGPMYLRVSRNELPEVTREDFVPGKVYPLRDGSDAVVFACGMMVSTALEAAKLLETQGVSVKVVNVPSLKPLDAAGVQAAAAGIPAVFTAEEHSVIGGLGASISEILGPVKRIGVEDRFGASAQDSQSLLKAYGLDAESVAARIAGQIG